MCISLHASEMSNTKLYAGEAMRAGAYVHVIAYSNTAVTRGPNAMILPIPAAAPVGPDNMIDTRTFRSFLGDIAEATKAPSFSRGISKSLSMDYDEDDALVFDKGSYTVVLASKMGGAMAAVDKIPAHKRPQMNPEVLGGMANLYPGWAFAICCWNGSIEAEPLLWWYEPRAPTYLFAPALDAHDGRAPRSVSVPVDHHIMFGSTLTPLGPQTVRYKEPVPSSVRTLLPVRAIGDVLQKNMPNGDFWFSTSGFKAAKPEGTALRFFPGPEAPKTTVPLSGQWG